jgi:hypothetical protein
MAGKATLTDDVDITAMNWARVTTKTVSARSREPDRAIGRAVAVT